MQKRCSIFSVSFNSSFVLDITGHAKLLWEKLLGIMATDLENNKDLSITVIEDKKFKTAAKKGVSITISLVMLGFSGWKDLEPGICFKKNS